MTASLSCQAFACNHRNLPPLPQAHHRHGDCHGRDIVDFGPVSPDLRVRWHSPKRDTVHYSIWEAQAMAFRLAFKAASRDDAAK